MAKRVPVHAIETGGLLQQSLGINRHAKVNRADNVSKPHKIAGLGVKYQDAIGWAIPLQHG